MTTEPILPTSENTRRKERPLTRTGGVPKRPEFKSYLMYSKYRTMSLPELMELGDTGAMMVFAQARWGESWETKQVCPKCGTIDAHYRVSVGAFKWKCASTLCKTQFSVFTDTCLHGRKLLPVDLLGILFQFVEAKDSISARQIGGLYGLSQQSAHVLLHKVREALQLSLKNAPPLKGEIHADGAYFIKYRRPGNVGTNRSRASKLKNNAADPDQVDADGKKKPYYHPDMHALIVFVQAGMQGDRFYKVVRRKTESNQVDLRKVAVEFCEAGSVIVTDQNAAYNQLGAKFEHHPINHDEHFQDAKGFNTNLAENFFSRMRLSQAGSWHRISVQYLELYGYEFAWRLTMVGKPNGEQFHDLLDRLLHSRRTSQFAGYWAKDPTKRPPREAADMGFVIEVPKDKIPKPTGRPAKNRLASAHEMPQKASRTRRRHGDEPTNPPPALPPQVSWSSSGSSGRTSDQ
jgi:hypothetical protein